MEQHPTLTDHSTIAAISTPPGKGGIAVIRVSGTDALALTQRVWKGKSLITAQTHTAHFGNVADLNGKIIDECVATVFRSPNSFTGEDTVEISCHGSEYIQNEIMRALIEAGAKTAGHGEFSQRAFLNGRLDLAQAEGIADLIAASSAAAHRLALSQLKGHFSEELTRLRDRLIDFASLVELEIDFSEEEVEFADRRKLKELAEEIYACISRLADSYSAGKVFKNGIPIAIAGIPNAGKSTLLNSLLSEERAIVSPIPGTTRDTIEDTVEINGLQFRFIDTAGLRESDDEIETIGISRARTAMQNAYASIWLIDPTSPISSQLEQLQTSDCDRNRRMIAINKADTVTHSEIDEIKLNLTKVEKPENIIAISARSGEGMEELTAKLTGLVTSDYNPATETIVTNIRHYESLLSGRESLRRVIESLESGLAPDLLAQDIRETAHHLSAVTGTISTPDLLQTIFSRFCIGK